MREIRYNLDSAIELAEEFTTHKINEHNLIILPNRPTWMVLSDREFTIFNKLIKSNTLRSVLDTYSEKEVYSVLLKIEQAHFYKDDISAEIDFLPPELVLNLTNQCNLRCVHCYSNSGKKEQDELTTQQWLDIIDQYSTFVSNGSVTLTGGEPTLFPDLLTILKKLKSKNHETVLFSNGTTNGGKFGWDKLCEYLDYVQFSFDGFTPEIHDRIRGPGAFNKVLGALKIVYKLDKPLRIGISLMPQNIDSIVLNLKKFLIKYDPDKKIGLILTPTVTLGRNKGEYSITFREVFSKVRDVLTEIWNVGWKIPKIFKKNVRRTRCGIGTSISITSTGGLKPCVFSKPTGHILEDKLIDWHYCMLEKYSKVSVDNYEQCKNCDLKYICSGGCVLFFEHRKRCSTDLEENKKIKKYFYERLIHETFI